MGTVEEFRKALKTHGADYVFQCPMPGYTEDRELAALIGSWRTREPNESRLVYKDPDPRFMIFEVLDTER